MVVGGRLFEDSSIVVGGFVVRGASSELVVCLQIKPRRFYLVGVKYDYNL